MDIENVLIITQKEIRDAWRNRWFLLYALAFAGLSFAFSWMTLSGSGSYGLAGYGRASASLVNLILLIVPLMGLTLGAFSLAGERERGTLLYLLAQPITPFELLLGKFVGLLLSLWAALGLGFGLTAVLLAVNGGGSHIQTYLTMLLLACLLAAVSLSIGYFISAAVSRTATAVGLALFTWLLLVFFGDLGLLGTAFVMQLKVSQLFTLSLINPLQLFKIAAILDLRTNLEILGPAGLYALRTYGGKLFPLLLGLLMLWVILPFLGTTYLFQRKGAL